MRLDLFLSKTGLVKRRPIAKALCDAGKVQRNGKVLKAGDELRMGDKLTIHYGVRIIEAEVLELPSGNVAKNQRENFYRILKEEKEADEI